MIDTLPLRRKTGLNKSQKKGPRKSQRGCWQNVALKTKGTWEVDGVFFFLRLVCMGGSDGSHCEVSVE